jgi:murein DD-endopeptidase MepM/ murein hydrolase activator NlpD
MVETTNEKSFKDKEKIFTKIGLNSKVVIPDCESQNSTNSSNTFTVNSISSISSLSNSVINPSSQSVSQVSTNSSTSSKTSFLDLIFGTVKASAAGTIVYDYRLPYPNGTNVSTNRTFNDLTTHANHNAIDYYSINSNGTKFNADVVAARSGTIYLSNASTGTTAGLGSNLVILQDDGNYALYAHLSGKYVSAGQQVSRGQKIGIQGDTGTHYDNFDNSHLHFEVLQPGILNYSTACQTDFNNCYNAFTLDKYKVYPAYDECWVARGGTQNNENNCKVSATGGNTGYPWRSQSSPLYWTSINTPPVTLYNNQPGTIDLVGVSDTWSLDVQGVGIANGTRVNMLKRTTAPNIAQKWQYFPSTKEIKGLNDLCLDSGNGNDGDYLRVNSCTGNNNQKWNFNANKTISNDQGNRCIQYESLYPSGSAWQAIIRNCTGSNQQTFVGTGMNIPSTAYKAIKSYTNSGLGFNIYGGYTADETKIQLFNLSNPAANNELFQMQSDGQIKSINGKCVDAWDVYNPNNRWLRILSCNGGTNQKFTLDGQARLHSVTAPSLCVESQLGNVSESTLYMNTCNNNTNQQWNLN